MKNYIKNLVKKLIRKYDTQSPDELAKALKITVIYAPLGDLWGMYKYKKKTRIIFINSSLPEIIRRFVLAHEIGHAVLHTKSTCYCHRFNIDEYKTEKEANIFASEYLLHDFDYSLLNQYTLGQIASMNYVPVELLEIKLSR